MMRHKCRLILNEVTRHRAGLLRIARRSALIAGGAATLALPHAACAAPDATALPTGGKVAAGNASIATRGARMDIDQRSPRAVINWQSYDVGASAHVNYNQPGSSAVTLNRVAAGNPSAIHGRISANGQVFLVNPSGVLFAPGARVDVGGLVASTLDIADSDFMAGRHRFDRNGAAGTIRNQGLLNAAEGGYIALLAPEIRNEGIVAARLGSVSLAAGDTITLDFSGDRLVQVEVDPATVNALIENKHLIQAGGGLVILSARAADRLIGATINNGGAIEADTLREQGGKIVLDSSGAVTNTGVISASGLSPRDSGGSIEISGQWVGLGGKLRADGARGGSIDVNATRLSLADLLSARGFNGAGGVIRSRVQGDVSESSTARSDASGKTEGGRIELLAGGAVLSSGTYLARGAAGPGGRIDLTGNTLRLLSATLEAGGNTQGGRVRVGGEFQGGKAPDIANDPRGSKAWAYVGRWRESSPLASARAVFVNDSSKLDVSARRGAGGTAIVWSDSITTMLGKVLALGAQGGGAVEISSADNLRQARLLNIVIGAGGHLLLDPKNIVVGDSATVSSWAYQAVLGRGYAPEKNVDMQALAGGANFGVAVALSDDASLMAVGASGDAGADGIVPNSGAIRLFSFSDGNFSGGALQATLGKGYAGGKNIDMAMLEAGDNFGRSVALNSDGSRLAVGAMYDDGMNNAKLNSGAVYLFSFASPQFANGALNATIGHGYTGGNNINLANLGASDYFGYSLALNGAGDRLAVGAPYDDGKNNSVTDSGAVHLFGFTSSTNFAGGTHLGSLGVDYGDGGGINQSVPGLEAGDIFGTGVALSNDGRLMAVGAYGDDGATNATSASGAVHLLNFSDGNFANGTLQATLGNGYTTALRARNVNLPTLEAGDDFGISVALNAAGNCLAVGAHGNDGFGNVATSSGAAYLFSFTDTGFSGGVLEATLGKGYSGGKNLDVAMLTSSDLFGYSVALNGVGDRLAVGAYGDDGNGNASAESGAVHLFSFSNASGPFSGGALEGMVGNAYAPSRNLEVSGLAGSDYFGRSVALSGDGLGLAVGNIGDDGADNGTTDAGAVRLFTFSDASFNGGSLQATLGKGYTGGKNVDVVNLHASDFFGQSVALSGDGKRLAVGAHGDDAADNATTNAGAVYLYSFADTRFSGGVQKGIIGKGYVGAGNVNLGTLDATDQFGIGVALNQTGNRLAVGAYADDGPIPGGTAGYGAVHLFSFAGDDFSAGVLSASLGKGYAGGKNVDVPVLASGDYFGYSVALNAGGDRLAVGAFSDDGESNQASGSGAVHLFSFSDGNFSAGSLQATLGKGYSGGKNVDVPGLKTNDTFGASVALNAAGDRLAVGAYADDGSIGQTSASGAVRLFSFSDAGGPFGGGVHQATLGKGYSGGKNIDIAGLQAADNFGYSVAFNASGNRLAVGAYLDDGGTDAASNSGAVHLFSFNDAGLTPFDNGVREIVLGKDYRSSGKDIDVASLNGGETIGYALALNGAGDRMAMGLTGDDGAGNQAPNSGAVHLFSFSDGNFSGGTLQSTLGKGYVGGRNLNVPQLDAGDNFGSALSFNTRGDRLAVGAIYDDGAGDVAAAAGAVYLFGFSDNDFSSGSLLATLGKGYNASTGARNIDVPALASGDYFGASVALNGAGDRLAVGATGDDGASNANSGAGAVYLFGFGDSSFGSGSLQATLGQGYASGKDRNVANLESADYFGAAVALNASGNRLAVGAYGDNGAGNLAADSGAVYLFSFTDSSFGGGALEGTFGKGYSAAGGAGAKSLDLGTLEASDYFGRSVALNAAGNRMAVGAFGDDGPTNASSGSGAVRLFSFSDGSFSGGTLTGTVGRGHSGTKDVDLSSAVGSSDSFGYAVAMNAAGDRMAISAYGDDGYADAASNTGAVHLIGFTDSDFSGGSLQGSIGKGYQGGRSINVGGLDASDAFGSSVALNASGSRLAVGARIDGGYGNGADSSGAVRLFGFTDGSFGGGSLIGTLGKGYTGGGNIDVTQLEAYDHFGAAVALNAAGERLAVGAPGDAGYGNAAANSGAAYLFNLATGNLEAIIGKGYGGSKDVNLATLSAGHRLGASLALNADGDRLAVGASGDAGAGAVHLFSFADTRFSGGSRVGSLGKGYAGAGNLDLAALLDTGDQFGSALALNGSGDRLAVGAYQDDGAGNSAPDSGAVHLFTFSNRNFSGASHAGTLGKGYAGGKSIALGSLEAGDYFGYSLALNRAGNRLAIGAIGDAGSGNVESYSGAVHLVGFDDGDFGNGSLMGTVGKNYSGGRNVDLPGLELNDYFGAAVALNGDGNRLAVGVPGDDGAGNGSNDSGAVYLLGFTDTSFAGGSLLAPMGAGYTGGKNIDVATLQNSGSFGYSVALNAAGDRLAVGNIADNGFGNSTVDSGAVRLFTFADGNFSGGTLQATLGKGYSGGNNLNVDLDAGDYFGDSVAFDASARRLAVGARYDAGFNNNTAGAGAVRLFSFTDNSFGGGKLEAMIGKDYKFATTGRAKDIDLGATLGSGDYFGTAVALNAAGDRLAIGAYGDDGGGAAVSASGGVYLYSFSDGNFSGGTLQARIGKNYNGGKNINVPSLEAGDYFGHAVALNAAGNLLAVGAYGDDGADNATNNAGAVHLFSFTDGSFGGGKLEATIGKGYAGGKHLNLSSLDADDYFGMSVALNGAGNILAAGASYDDGQGNVLSGVGAVHLFGFADTGFAGGTRLATLGKGYAAGKDVDVAALGLDDHFGSGVALNGAGDRMAVGAYTDDGASNGFVNSGAVYLFSATAETTPMAIDSAGFGIQGGSDVSVSAAAVAQQLSAGTAVTLQANNDITLSAAIRADNPGGNGGALTLQAGRSIAIDASVSTDGGTLSLIGNETLAGGVIDSFRLPGAATITQAAGTTLDAGTGAISILLKDGAGKTHAGSGGIAVVKLSGGAVSIANRGVSPDSGVTIDGEINAAALAVSSLTGSVNINQALAIVGDGATTLQAGKDIKVAAPIGAGNPLGDGGGMLFQAGRALYLNASISTDNGQLSIIGNQAFENGPRAAALPGSAKIIQGPDALIDAGSAAITIELKDDPGQPAAAGGAIELAALVGGSLSIANYGRSAASGIVFKGSLRASSLGASSRAGAIAINGSLSARGPGGISLLANNDIAVRGRIGSENAAGRGGDVSLRAGRSIRIDSDIVSGGGDISITANGQTADGIDSAFRFSGTATIVQAAGTRIESGSGALAMLLRDGAGRADRASGSIKLHAASGNAISIRNDGTAADSSIDLAGAISASGSGNSLVLAGHHLTSASTASLSAAKGRWLVYLKESPQASSFHGALESGNTAIWNTQYAVTPPSAVSLTGNRYLFDWQPTLTLTTTNLNKAHGEDAAGMVGRAWSIAGLHPGVSGAFRPDTPADAFSGLPLVTSKGSAAAADAGGYAITAEPGTMIFRGGYAAMLKSSGTLVVLPAPGEAPSEAPKEQPSSVPTPAVEVLLNNKSPLRGLTVNETRKEARTLLKAEGSDPGVRLTQLASHALERRKAREALYHDAFEKLKQNPDAAALPACGSGSGSDDICIPPPAFAASDAASILPPSEIGRRIAVLIGNTSYRGDIPALESPERDVDVFGKLLQEKMGFEVVTLKNATRADIVRSLRQLAESTRRDESVMVMYAGHGFQPEDKGEGFWLPIDARQDDPERWISNRDITRMLQAIPAKQVLLLSDSCFAGSLASGEQQAPANERGDLLSRRAVMVLASGGEEPVSDEGKDGHSVFAYHLIKQLRDADRATTLSRFFGSLEQAVSEDFPQKPTLGSVRVAGHMPGADYLLDFQ